jgi:hydroxymethylbilane synthase
MTDANPLIRLGTRGSPLALAQAHEVQRRLRETHEDLAPEGAVEVVVIKTTGDRVTDRALSEIGGKGLFTKEIEQALEDDRIDCAVHSMKDVPTWLPDGMALAAYLPREDVRDAFFSPHGNAIADLPDGATVGSASLRRQAQILLTRPDVKVTLIRGNVDTRLRKLADGEVEMLPAVGQGAVGLEVRAADERTYTYVRALNHAETEARVEAERACLAVLDGSCRTPIAALAEVEGDSRLRFRALIAEPDGSAAWRTERTGVLSDARALARDAGRQLRTEAGEAFFERLADLF